MEQLTPEIEGWSTPLIEDDQPHPEEPPPATKPPPKTSHKEDKPKKEPSVNQTFQTKNKPMYNAVIERILDDSVDTDGTIKDTTPEPQIPSEFVDIAKELGLYELMTPPDWWYCEENMQKDTVLKLEKHLRKFD